jgi:hypothetical protein
LGGEREGECEQEGEGRERGHGGCWTDGRGTGEELGRDYWSVY